MPPNRTRTKTGRACRLARASAVAVAVAAVAGCSNGDPPSELPVPDVTWSDSAPSGDLEDSRWVQVVREAEALSSVAWNNLDYSDPDLIAAWGYDTVVEALYWEAQLRFVPGMYDIHPLAPSLLDWGPNPLVVLDVQDHGDSGAVIACAVDTRTVGSGEVDTVEVRTYNVRILGDGATEIGVKRADPPLRKEIGDECGLKVLPEVLFEPPPEFPSGPDIEVRPPAGRHVYEELRGRSE